MSKYDQIPKDLLASIESANFRSYKAEHTEAQAASMRQQITLRTAVAVNSVIARCIHIRGHTDAMLRACPGSPQSGLVAANLLASGRECRPSSISKASRQVPSMTAAKRSNGLLMRPRSLHEPSPTAAIDSARDRTCRGMNARVTAISHSCAGRFICQVYTERLSIPAQLRVTPIINLAWPSYHGHLNREGHLLPGRPLGKQSIVLAI